MTSHAAHPSFVTLAAFVDGRLSGKDLAQVVKHLASCEDCFEVVAETAEVQEELEEEAASAGEAATAGVPSPWSAESEALPDNVVMHPSAWKRWAPAAALLAAGLAVAVVGGWQMGWLFGDPLSVDRLAGRLEDSASRLGDMDWDDRGWPNFRAGEPVSLEERAGSFRAGALALELQLALRSGDQGRAESVYPDLITAFRQDSLSDAVPVLLAYEAPEFKALGSGKALSDPDLTALAARAAELDLQTPGLLDPHHYALGKWAEAGRLAARAGDARALQARAFRNPLEDFVEADLDPEVVDRLQVIQQRLREELDQEDLDWLAGAFRSIVGGDGVRLQTEIPEPELPSDTSPPSGSPER